MWNSKKRTKLCGCVFTRNTAVTQLECFSVDKPWSDRRGSSTVVVNPPPREAVAWSTEEFFSWHSAVYMGMEGMDFSLPWLTLFSTVNHASEILYVGHMLRVQINIPSEHPHIYHSRKKESLPLFQMIFIYFAKWTSLIFLVHLLIHCIQIFPAAIYAFNYEKL